MPLLAPAAAGLQSVARQCMLGAEMCLLHTGLEPWQLS